MFVAGYTDSKATTPSFEGQNVDSEFVGQVLAAAIRTNPTLKCWVVQEDPDLDDGTEQDDKG